MRRTEGTETSEYLEEEKTTVMPPVVASDRGPAQTAAVATQWRGSRTTLRHLDRERNGLESPAREGDSPVCEATSRPSGILSNAGHEKACAKPPGPSGKAKYFRETDSEPVP